MVLLRSSSSKIPASTGTVPRPPSDKREPHRAFIESLFSEAPDAKSAARGIIALLRNHDLKLSPRDLSTLMLRCGKLSQNRHKAIPIDNQMTELFISAIRYSNMDGFCLSRAMQILLAAHHDHYAPLHEILAEKLENVREMNSKGVSMCLYAMHRFHQPNPAIARMLTALESRIQHCHHFTGQGVSNALYGMRGLSSDMSEVQGVLAALTKKLTGQRIPFNVQEMGLTYYGLQGMSSAVPEVKGFLTALAENVAEGSDQALDVQAIGAALFGLRRCVCDCEEVRVTLRVLTAKIQATHVVLDGPGIGAALFGLQSMSAEPEVREVLRALLAKIDTRIYFSHMNIGNSLFGLQKMTAEHPEVRAMLAALAVLIGSSRDVLSDIAIGFGLLGLQKCSSEVAEVRAVVAALGRKMSTSEAVLEAEHVLNALIGLQCLSSVHEEVRLLVKELSVRIAASPLRLDVAEEVMESARIGLQRMDPEVSEVRGLLAILESKFKRR